VDQAFNFQILEHVRQRSRLKRRNKWMTLHLDNGAFPLGCFGKGTSLLKYLCLNIQRIQSIWYRVTSLIP